MRAIKIGSFLSVFVGSWVGLFSVPRVSAQSVPPARNIVDDQPQTVTGGVFEGGTAISGWFVAPTFGTSGFGGSLAYEPGLRGGIYLNRRIALGVEMNGIGIETTDISKHQARDFGAFGGLLLQYVAWSNRLVHTSLETTIGSGRWCTLVVDGQDGCTGRRFIAFEPAANVELNIARHLRVATGVGYRFAVAGSGEGPSSGEMSSLVVRTSLVFGSF